MQGSMYQDVHFRVTKYNASGAIVDARYCKCPQCRHSAAPELNGHAAALDDTYGYRSMDGVDPSSPVPGMGHDAGSKVASMFYQTILDSKVFWDNTMEFEGTTKFTLPRSNGEQLNVRAQPHADNTNCRAEQGRTGCASRTRRGTTSCATRSSARTLGKLPRCRRHLLHSSKDASDIIAGRFPKYGVLPNVYGSPATWNADLTIVSSMNMALHVGAEVTLRTLGTCPLYRRLMAHSSGLVAGCAGELPDARDAVRAGAAWSRTSNHVES